MTKIDKTIKLMREYLKELDEELENKIEEISNEENLAKAKEIVESTKLVVNNCIEKVKAKKDEIKNDEKLEEFLDKLRAKTKEAVEIGKEKIEQITQENSSKEIDELTNSVMAEFDKLKQSELGKKTKVMLKEIDGKVNEFFEKPEVKNAIHKAKKTTVNLAQKGVDGLKKLLDSENQDEQ